MANNEQRKIKIVERINELNEVLDQWEDKRNYSENPSERQRCEAEIKKIKGYIKNYELELSGGQVVVEDKADPVIAPELKKLNRRWIRGIAITLVSLLLLSWGYFEMTAVKPNYESYLKFLAEGDSLIVAESFEPARKAYKMAQAYFPKDTAVARKLELLEAANRAVEQQKYKEATSTFEMIIDIPPGQGFEASLSIGDVGSDTGPSIDGSTTPSGGSSGVSPPAGFKGLRVTISLKADKTLVITVMGGTPFGTLDNPYKIKGWEDHANISWTKSDKNYIASIPNWDINITSVDVYDSAGNNFTQKVDPRETQMVLYTESRAEGDKLFKAKDFNGAKKAYEVALEYRRGDAYCTQQIAKCEEEKIIAQIIKSRKRIVGGSFTMGDKEGEGYSEEKPTRTVNINNFRLMSTEVTVAQYRSFAKANGRSMPPAPPWGWNDNDPIVNVSWADALDFCKWVRGRLPTEAEWEYAARGGNMASGFKYSGSSNLASVANYNGNSKSKPKNVKSKKANELGLYDMSGNVSEWVSDWFGKKYYGENVNNNPRGPASGKYKVVRGGHYTSSPNAGRDGDQLRLSYRNNKTPNTKENYVGFRVAWNG